MKSALHEQNTISHWLSEPWNRKPLTIAPGRLTDLQKKRSWLDSSFLSSCPKKEGPKTRLGFTIFWSQFGRVGLPESCFTTIFTLHRRQTPLHHRESRRLSPLVLKGPFIPIELFHVEDVIFLEAMNFVARASRRCLMGPRLLFQWSRAKRRKVNFVEQ